MHTHTVQGATPAVRPAASVTDHLRRLQPAIARVIDDETTEFFRTDGTDSPSDALLEWLDPAELGRLRIEHAEHLTALCAATVDDALLAQRSRHVGRVHAMVGVEIDWYVDAMLGFRDVLDRALADLLGADEQTAVMGVIDGRLLRDVHEHLHGFLAIEQATTSVAADVGRVAAEARTVSDLAHDVLTVLARLPGLVIGYFGRADSAGVFQSEVGVGDQIDAFLAVLVGDGPPPISTVAATPGGSGPLGTAWRSGEIVRSDSYATDPRTGPWHEIGRELGLRSSVAIPLTDSAGRPLAALSLYGRWPGFFAYPARARLLEHVRELVQSALARLESYSEPTSAVSNFQRRAKHVALLDRRQVVMLFQPVVNLRTGQVTRFEALGRLLDGDRLISPAEFLPSLGQSDLLHLFAVGVDQSLGAVRDWSQAGLDVGVSVNLPAAFALPAAEIAQLRAALDRYAVAPSRLTLEVLETGAFADDAAEYNAMITELRSLGIRIAEDDLGSGYSSLLRLRNLDFDGVKIDQDLVRGSAAGAHEGLAFVQPLTALAHSMGMTVTVEGLETAGLIEAAAVLGADHGQGYGLARPMPADEVPAWTRGFRLAVDPSRPRTGMGALAAHIAWEARVATHAGRSDRRAAPRDPCLLTDFLARWPGRGGAAAAAMQAHQDAHQAVLGGVGSASHRAAWRTLADAVLVGGS